MIKKITTWLHKKQAVIAISGKSGCGNTTLSNLIAGTFDMKLVNYTFRSLALDRGISLEDVMEMAAESDEIDRFIDTRQLDLAKGGSSVLASRLAIWLKKDAVLKVYLRADFRVRAERIGQRENWSMEKSLAHTEKRDKEDHQRYVDIYGIDNDAYQFADLILDTSTFDPKQLLEVVIGRLQEKIGGNAL